MRDLECLTNNPGSVESSKERWLWRKEGNDIIRSMSQEPLLFKFCFQILGFIVAIFLIALKTVCWSKFTNNVVLYSSAQQTESASRIHSDQFSSVQFSRSVMSNSWWPHELQHARPPCPSPTPRVYSNSCPWSRWCHPTISSSVVPFSSCLQSFPASGSFPMSQLFASGGQSTGVSASGSVLPMNTQDWSPSGWTGWISLQSKGLSRVFSNTIVQKYQFFSAQLSL